MTCKKISVGLAALAAFVLLAIAPASAGDRATTTSDAAGTAAVSGKKAKSGAGLVLVANRIRSEKLTCSKNGASVTLISADGKVTQTFLIPATTKICAATNNCDASNCPAGTHCREDPQGYECESNSATSL